MESFAAWEWILKVDFNKEDMMKKVKNVKQEKEQKKNKMRRKNKIKRKKKLRRNKIMLAVGTIIAVCLFVVLANVSYGRLLGNWETIRERILVSDRSYLDMPADGRWCVVLDPGHGGRDPGAVHGGVMEKDLNLAMAFRVRDYLEEMGYRVVLTREDDSAVSLSERAAIARRANANVVVSIHHNAVENNTVAEGIETWYYDERHEMNRVFAEMMQREMVNSTGAEDRGLFIGRRLTLLRNLSMPACLVEVGFMTSGRERAQLVCPEYQQRIARGIANGVDAFFSAL